MLTILNYMLLKQAMSRGKNVRFIDYDVQSFSL